MGETLLLPLDHFAQPVALNLWSKVKSSKLTETNVTIPIIPYRKVNDSAHADLVLSN